MFYFWTVLLFSNQEKEKQQKYGAIDANCNVGVVVQHAFEDAKFLCENYYLSSPEVNVNVYNCKYVAVER